MSPGCALLKAKQLLRAEKKADAALREQSLENLVTAIAFSEAF